MKPLAYALLLFFAPWVAHAAEPADASLAEAVKISELIMVCTVVDEGPLGHGDKGTQKSYLVSFQLLKLSIDGLGLPDKVRIQYDSTDFPKELRSGKEADFHQGDRFVALLDYDPQDSKKGFRIIRLEDISKKKAITELLAR